MELFNGKSRSKSNRKTLLKVMGYIKILTPGLSIDVRDLELHL